MDAARSGYPVFHSNKVGLSVFLNNSIPRIYAWMMINNEAFLENTASFTMSNLDGLYILARTMFHIVKVHLSNLIALKTEKNFSVS